MELLSVRQRSPSRASTPPIALQTQTHWPPNCQQVSKRTSDPCKSWDPAPVHRGLPYFDAVRGHYGPGEIAFVDGEDEHGWSNFSAALPEMGHYFMRELPDGCPPEVEVEGGFFASSGYLVL